jgi:glycyl-tRNA synthetase
LPEEKKAVLKTEFESNENIILNINEKKFTLDKKHISFEQKIVNVSEEKFTPSVIEPSFGLGRILSAVLEHSFKMRDEKRTYLCLKPKIAPVKVSILPLQSDERFDVVIADISKYFIM